ncbi:MAG TPA: MBOAT family O-acyltransferase [Pyrinomonadaceae bacterium]
MNTFYTGKYMIFLALVFFAYWMFLSWRFIPTVARVIFITGVSYYFYALLNWKFLALVFVMSTVDFLVARSIGASTDARRRKLLLCVSILTDIGTLAVFKYFNFFTEPLSRLLGQVGLQVPPAALLLVFPVGLSFLAFRSLSYVIDTYRNTKEKPQRPDTNYFEYLAFVSFFPTVEIGPLTRAHQLIPQFRQKPTLRSEDGTHAIFLMMLGAIKFAVANFLWSNLVEDAFKNPTLYSSTEILAAIYGYALFIYLNFSGYVDIGIGSARLLGFDIPINFNSPYRAKNMPDFWRRWHITLSEWLRDYVFSSLPGSPRKTYNLYWKAVVTMLIGGIWHGAGWTFIIWGAMHGVGVAVNQWWEQRRRKLKRRPRQQWWIKALCVFATFHFVCLTWVFFASGTVGRAWSVLARLGEMQFSIPHLTATTLTIPFGSAFSLPVSVLVVLILGYLAHWFPKNALDRVRTGWTWLPSPAQAVLILGVAFSLYYFASATAPLVYGNF